MNTYMWLPHENITMADLGRVSTNANAFVAQPEAKDASEQKEGVNDKETDGEGYRWVLTVTWGPLWVQHGKSNDRGKTMSDWNSFPTMGVVRIVLNKY